MSKYSHISLSYVINRISQMAYQKLHPDAPWLTGGAIAFLDQWLRPDDTGVEWGSGRSTLWFAKRVAHLTSIEDNRQWAKIVRNMLVENGIGDTVDYRFVAISQDVKGPSSPYVQCVANILPGSIDFCLVDGDLRDHCALAAIDLLKPSGLLIIDNAERYLPREPVSRSPNSRSMKSGHESEEWAKFSSAIDGWRCFWTSNGVSDTAFWIKPCSE
ncbi:hypothetical protein [uncultured Rhodoblastus sp.]|uniref:O-methyltransferase n=1 Tax=uncultured Rhodoblastus sp. TaxID=543037 RepID=UPI0025CD1DB9|nr:hypothetical protein [uncultured Rhodoblastus sp.]